MNHRKAYPKNGTIVSFFGGSSIVLVLALTLAALVPLFNSRLPFSADGKSHLFRAVEMDWLLRNGVWWPRIAPDMAYGYGYPIFNYYAPLLYYLITALHRLGLDFAPALQAAFALSLLGGAAGVFRMTADLSGKVAGGLAAGLYAFAPYILYNAIRRGDAAEIFALGMVPWLLWSVRQVVMHPGAWPFLRLALLYAALLLSHNITALVVSPLLAGYTLVLLADRRPILSLRRTAVYDPTADRRLPSAVCRLLPAVVALALGLAIAAFFWLPALREGSYVQLHQLTGPAMFDFRENFLTPADLLQLPPAFDPRQELPPVPFTPGLVQLGMAALGVASLKRLRGALLQSEGAFFALALIVMLSLTLPLSLPIWERISILRFVQFPARFLGPAAVVAAILGGMAFGVWWREARWGPALASLLLAAAALSGFSATYTNRFPPILRPGLQEIYQFEVGTGVLGTTSTGEFLPVAVKQLPLPDSLRERYAESQVIDRLDRARLPASVTVISAESRLLAATAVLDSPEPFVVTFDWFYFPGWQARVDSGVAAIRPSDPHGLITFDVPAGRHIVQVDFGPTPLRRAASLISMAGVVLLGAGAYLLRRARTPPPPSPDGTSRQERGARGVRLLALTGLALGLFRLWLGDRASIFNQSRFDGRTVAGVDQALEVNFGDRLALIGMDLEETALPSDRPVEIALYWRVIQPLEDDYSISVKLYDGQGHFFGQADSQHPGGQPASRWSLESYARDLHRIEPYPGAPPGEYAIAVSVYPVGGGPALSLLNPDHVPVGTEFEASRIKLTAPARPVSDEALAPGQLLKADFGEVELIGLDLPAQSAVGSGDLLPLVLYWRANASPETDLTARLSLSRKDAGPVTLADFSPVSADYPTLAWSAGEGLRAPHEFLIPPQIPAGSADLVLTLRGPPGQQIGPAIPLGQVSVVAPERSFVIPEMSESLGLKFGAGTPATDAGAVVELLGYDVAPPQLAPGDELSVTLYWRSLNVVATRYIVFVHLLDSSRGIVSQVDAMPLSGARPTTGWLPDEVLTDPYSLAVSPDTPPGEYLIEVGLYDPQTGERLLVADSSGQIQGDRVILDELLVPQN